MRRCASFRSSVPVPEQQGAGGAGGGAGGRQAHGLPVGAEGAFADQGHRRLPLELGNLEGTGHHAVAAADALVVVIDHRPLRQLRQGPHRAGAGAGRVIAMHAAAGDKMPFQPAIGTGNLPEDDAVIFVAAQVSRVGPGLAEGGFSALQIVPALACHLAGPAADTLGGIDQDGFAHMRSPLGLQPRPFPRLPGMPCIPGSWCWRPPPRGPVDWRRNSCRSARR